MDIDRVRDAKGKGKKGKIDRQKGKGKDASGRGKKGKESRKEKKMIARAKERAKTTKEKVWQLVTLVGSQDILLETVRETIFDVLQPMQPIHPQEELQRLLIQLVNNKPFNVSEQSSSTETKPWSEGLRIVGQLSLTCEKDMMKQKIMDFEELIHFDIADDDDDDDDDDEPGEEGGNPIEENSMEIEIENQESKARRFGDERDMWPSLLTAELM